MYFARFIAEPKALVGAEVVGCQQQPTVLLAPSRGGRACNHKVWSVDTAYGNPRRGMHSPVSLFLNRDNTSRAVSLPSSRGIEPAEFQ